MTFNLSDAEGILLSDSLLRKIYNQKYELSFESSNGRQIGLNRRPKDFVGVWIENSFDANRIGLSSTSHVEHYPPHRTRAHLSASRSEEHTSELQSLMRISYAVFCLKKQNIYQTTH